jgi:hypothetical protein
MMNIPTNLIGGGLVLSGIDPEPMGIRDITEEDPTAPTKLDKYGLAVAPKDSSVGIRSRVAWSKGRWSYNPYSTSIVETIAYSEIDTYAKRQSQAFKGLKLYGITTVEYYNQFKKYLIIDKTGPLHAVTKNKIFLTSVPTLTRVVYDGSYAASTNCIIEFTNNIINQEIIDDIYYSLDDGLTWNRCGSKTSPITISLSFNLNFQYSMCIRYADNLDAINENSKKNTFAMNDYYSESLTNGQCTWPIRVGTYGPKSNNVPITVRNLRSPPPFIYYVYYESKNTYATVYFDQKFNITGNIKDYEWSTNGGVTWTPANLNLTGPVPYLTPAQLTGNSTPQRLFSLFNNRFKRININVGKKSKRYTVMMRSVPTLLDYIVSESSNSVSSTSYLANQSWLNELYDRENKF